MAALLKINVYIYRGNFLTIYFISIGLLFTEVKTFRKKFLLFQMKSEKNILHVVLSQNLLESKIGEYFVCLERDECRQALCA